MLHSGDVFYIQTEQKCDLQTKTLKQIELLCTCTAKALCRLGRAQYQQLNSLTWKLAGYILPVTHAFCADMPKVSAAGKFATSSALVINVLGLDLDNFFI